MAGPFGEHPNFAQYIGWARAQGCEVQSGVVYDTEGGAYAQTIITAPSGRWVVETRTQQNEYLTPTTIARLDRRLGLTSPYFTIDPDSPPN